jgi:DNA (cytosine-5)-methyltransferase 1
MKLKVIDLCSGIGGFSYGLEKTGYFKTIQFVEINPFCQKVLKKNFPGTPIHDDIKTYKPVKADVVTSGFPCQPFSIAGKQDGKNDDRNLWGETLRVIKQSRPTFFIGENVFGIVKLYLDTILKDLEEADYSTRCFNISASGVGARHVRKRIFIIAYCNSGLRNNEKKKIQTRRTSINNGSKNVSNTEDMRYRGRNCSKCKITQRSFLQTEQKRSSLGSETSRCCQPSIQNLSNTNKIRLQRLRIQGNKKSNQYEQEKISLCCGKEKPGEAAWKTQSDLLRSTHALSYKLDKDRVNRIKAIGNSLVPKIPYLIGLAIKNSYETSH